MHRLINRLLHAIDSSPERGTRDEAIVRLATLLDKCGPPVLTVRAAPSQGQLEVSEQNYSDELPPELLALRLEASDQAEIINHVRKKLLAERLSPSLLWLLGRASPNIGLAVLLGVMRVRIEEFDDECAFQAIGALGRLIEIDADGRLTSDTAALLNENAPTEFLDRMAKSMDPRVSDGATFKLRYLSENLREL